VLLWHTTRQAQGNNCNPHRQLSYRIARTFSYGNSAGDLAATKQMASTPCYFHVEQILCSSILAAADPLRLTVMPSCWTTCLHEQPTWSARRSAGRLLVKLCIEVCICFYRTFWIRLSLFF
jgi:hypothetical protein